MDGKNNKKKYIIVIMLMVVSLALGAIIGKVLLSDNSN